MDSEEEALASGLAIAKYAFGVDPITLLRPPSGESATLTKTEIEFDVMFDAIMFPSILEEVLAGDISALMWFFKHWIPVWGPGHGGHG